MSVPVNLPAWTSSNGRLGMDVVLPELYLEPVMPVQADIDMDDNQSDASSDSQTHEEILPPQSHNIHHHVVWTVPCSMTTDEVINLRNPLGVFHLTPNSSLTDEHPVNQLIHAIQLEHCRKANSGLKGGLLVVELSSEHASNVVDLPYEHIKFIKLIIALYVPHQSCPTPLFLLFTRLMHHGDCLV